MSGTAPLTAEQWRRVNDVFHRALAVPAGDRRAFLEDACGGDVTLLVEVASLLDAHGQAGEFIETPAAAPADLIAVAAAGGALAIGQVVGQYRIERLLGEGGMGVVYLAEDLRLGRQVALKAVAPGLTGDPAHRERLRREARAAAALTHPGIATVYALEEFDGHVYIAGEYVPGETLRDELGRGPLGIDRTLETASLIARALAAAHDRGVVHRDLKPENVMRTPSGEVKILDFGLARMRDVPTDATRLTGGRFVGTPAYMSPEQIRGETVDARSDIFSLGTMLYELMSGTNPFTGSDTASTIARILELEPARPIRDVAPAAPGASTQVALEGIVRTCLSKLPAARFASAHDLVRAIDQARKGEMRQWGPSTSLKAGNEAMGQFSNAALPAVPAAQGAIWWWQFHQAAASAGYGLLLVPLWLARQPIGGRTGLLLFLGGLVAAVAAAILRMHLWFAVRSYPAEWPNQRRRTTPWLKTADAAFVAVLFTAGIAAAQSTATEVAAVLIAAAVVVLLSFTIIEPATTRAAFGDPPIDNR